MTDEELKAIEERALAALVAGQYMWGEWFTTHARADIPALLAEVRRLREALTETADTLEDALAYKQDYLREKHGDDETLAKARALLSPKP